MLIVFGAGLSPVKVTFPVTVATAAGSIGADGGASAFFYSGFGPPQEEISSTPATMAGNIFETNAIGYIIVFNPLTPL